MAPSRFRRGVLMFFSCAAALLVLAACGGADEPDASVSGDAGAAQTEVAAGVATQSALQQQIDASVAATITAQAPASDPTATDEPTLEPTELAPTASPPAPAPTATPEPPSPTATAVPPTATPEPPPPAPTATQVPPTPTEVPPTPTPMPTPEDVLVFDAPTDGFLSDSGRNGSFAQASASFEITQFPARAYVRSGVYFGLGEDVRAAGIIQNAFNTAPAAKPGGVTISVDASWSGELRTNGWGSMTSSFEVALAVVDANGQNVAAPDVAGQTSIDSNLASKPVSGNRTLSVYVPTEPGQTYYIWLVADCRSTGSSNVFASDSECIFDNHDGVNGYVQWSNLELRSNRD